MAERSGVLAHMGPSAIAPTFWTLPTAMLPGTAAAGGSANAVGNLEAFLGPYVVGFIKDTTGSLSIARLAISLGALVGAVVLLALGHDRRLEQVHGVQEELGSV